MKTLKIMIAVIALAAVFAACDSGWEEKIRPTTKLESLTVQPVSINPTTGMPVIKVDKNNQPVEALTVKKIPDPVNEGDWDYTNYNLAEADSSELWFLLEEDTERAVLSVTSTPGTIVKWGVGGTATPPTDFYELGKSLEFGDDQVIYVRVSTRDEQYRSYYRIHARLASPVTLLSLITVAGRETKTPYDTGAPTWDAAKAMSREDPDGDMTAEEIAGELDVSITLKEGTNGSDILAVKNDEQSSVSYVLLTGDYHDYTEAQIDALFSAPDCKKEGDKIVTVWDPAEEMNVDHEATDMKFADQNWLIAKVTAQNKDAVSFYKFRVSVGHIATIAELKLTSVANAQDGPATPYQIVALGVPNEDWDTVVSGSFATANRDPAFSVAVTPDDEDATFEFVKIANATAPEPAFNSPANITFGNKEELAIKVSSATQISSVPAVVMYYKVRVDLQSAIITVQPKSAVYNVLSHTYPTTATQVEIGGEQVTQNRVRIDATGTRVLDKEPVALEAVLDRTGTFTYQWYSANSWYGGYGFDAEGRIVGDPGFTNDAYHPTTARGGLDEKNNVSFHNGGNEFYRLPVGSYPDTVGAGTAASPNYKAMHDALAIAGATSATYVPKIDASKRPFIAGYSNQTQYYWVVIKDPSGRSVTSERATIVAEWGQEWDMGQPGAKLTTTKKHHIVDLYAYMTPGAVGLRDKPINTQPFTFHREKRIIPITFPSDFRVMDYRVATIQARFFLADGTVWIQNWTQGDVGFERNGVGLVLWYNLTNNNAAVGLAGDSKEPQGANLTEIPTHVVIKPAGEKPPKDRPPFQLDGKTPRPNNDAQGWFTPYIEIVELRFEGPAR